MRAAADNRPCCCHIASAWPAAAVSWSATALDTQSLTHHTCSKLVKHADRRCLHCTSNAARAAPCAKTFGQHGGRHSLRGMCAAAAVSCSIKYVRKQKHDQQTIWRIYEWNSKPNGALTATATAAGLKGKHRCPRLLQAAATDTCKAHGSLAPSLTAHKQAWQPLC